MRAYLSWDPIDGTGPKDTGSITVAGLGNDYIDGGYRVVVYFDADQNDRTFDITVGDQTITAADASTFSGTFIDAATTPADANYAVFENLTTDTFTIARHWCCGGFHHR